MYAALPAEVQKLKRKNYKLWQRDPGHASLHFKRLQNDYWSARAGLHYRAIGKLRDDTIYWFWIGSHSDFNALVKQIRSSFVRLILLAHSSSYDLRCGHRRNEANHCSNSVPALRQREHRFCRGSSSR